MVTKVGQVRYGSVNLERVNRYADFYDRYD